ncbi:MAG TPA: M28 family peptidase [Gemmatimonadales bacterium]|nr:M28 family peptidase [Gemmatimonadales bacterium]
MSGHRSLFTDLAAPRLVGSAAHRLARSLLSTELSRRGFTVDEQRFRASAVRLRAVALLGGVLALAGLAATIRTLWGPGSGRLALWATGLTGLATLAAVIAAWVRRPPVPDGVNLIATRPGAIPRVWLVAHYDSKGQGLSMRGRLAAVAASVVGAGLLAGAGAALVLGALPSAGWWLAGAVPAALGGYGLLAAGVRNDSPGAVDNATGVLTALAVADLLPPAAPVGVLLTDAEELGLLGATAAARERPDLFRDAAVVNVDGIDDRGPVVAFVHRPGAAVDAIARALGARRARWLPVVVDGVPLARVSRECVTLLKGDWSTMGVVHTRRDTVERLTLAGVEAVSAGVAAVLGAVVAS